MAEAGLLCELALGEGVEGRSRVPWERAIMAGDGGDPMRRAKSRFKDRERGEKSFEEGRIA